MVAGAFGDLTPTFLEITATNDLGSDTYTVLTTEATYDGMTYTWSDSGHSFTNGAGLDSINLVISGDPQIFMSLAMQAGATDTTFQISTAQLSFVPLNPAQAAASAGLTITDTNGDGALLTGLSEGGMSYLAQYNGAVPTGTTFAAYIPQVFEPNAGGSESVSANSGGLVGIGGPISDMGVELAFELSAADTVSGTNNFVILPEPATLCVLGLGLLLLRRR